MTERSELAVHQGYTPLAPYAPAQPVPTPADAQEPPILLAIVRQWWLILLFALLGVGVAMIYLKQAQPRYTAFSRLYIAPASGPVLETLGAMQRASFLYTQCEVLRSTPILTRAANELGELKTFGQWGGVAYMRHYLKAEVGRRDDIINVSIDTPHPEESALIVNAVVTAYAEASMEERETTTIRLLRTLEQTKAEADAEVRALEDQMAKFQQANPSLAIEPIISQELTTLSAALVQAQIASIDARAGYGAGHQNVRIAQRIEEERYNRYQQALRKHLDVNVKAAEYARMRADLDQSKERSARLLERIRELEIRATQAQQIASVDVLDPAEVPWAPSSPRRYRTLAVALIAGAMLGAGLALVRDRMDSRMRSVEEIQTILGMPVLGVVPAMSGRRTAVARAMTVHLDPRSVVAEAYRGVRTAIYFGAGTGRCKTLLLTSPEPGDGKTTTASNLAIAIAQTGRTVLLLDADFRKPTQHKNLDIKDSIGLSSVLAGRAPVAKAIQHTGVEGLDILPCGPIPANPSEILNSREFGELIDALSSKYDHILFDSPPVNPVTDARILGAVSDATILVVRADKSTRKTAEHARNALLAVGARVLGVVVNDAPQRKGYEVYGGSYYGQPDVAVRPGTYEQQGPRRQLPHWEGEDDDPRQQRRDIA